MQVTGCCLVSAIYISKASYLLMAKLSPAKLSQHDIPCLVRTHFTVFSCHIFAAGCIQALVHHYWFWSHDHLHHTDLGLAISSAHSQRVNRRSTAYDHHATHPRSSGIAFSQRRCKHPELRALRMKSKFIRLSKLQLEASDVTLLRLQINV